ncbi:MAG: hypothetical protein LN417_06430, partial [Candidatus Thermoplasmatota archaeon]|nr:hypothetical protein [Candidatus Thermoplasmatota archaeon]
DELSLEPAQERKPAKKRARPPRRVRRATRILRNASVPEHIIRSLDTDDLVDWASEVLENQTATERRRLAEAPGETPERARQATEPKDTGKEDALPTVSLDFGTRLKAYADKMGISEDEAGATLGPLLNHVAQEAAAAAVRSLRPELDQTRASMKESTEERGQRVIGENLERLTQLHPELEDDALLRDELLKKAGANWKQLGGDLYETPDEAFDDAFRATIGPLEHPEKKAKSKRRRARRNGRATIPQGQRTAKVSRSYEDYEKDVFIAGQRGANFSQLQKIRKPSRASTRKEKARLFQ